MKAFRAGDEEFFARKESALRLPSPTFARLKRLSVHWPLVLPSAMIAGMCRAWFGPGTIVGEDFRQPSPSQLAAGFPWPSGWDASFGAGRSLVALYPSDPIWWAAGLLHHLGAGWAVIERCLWLFPFAVLAVAAPYVLAYRLTRSPHAAAVSAAAFAVNTWTVGLIERGHIPSLVAYALMPLVALQCLRCIAQPTPPRALGLSALGTLQIAYDIRYAYISAIICLVISAFKFRSLQRRGLRAAAPTLAYFVASAVVFNLYWIVPAAIHPERLDPSYTSLEGFASLSKFEDLPHSVAFFFPFYHHIAGSDGFHVDAVEPLFFVVPCATLCGLALAWRTKGARITAVLMVIGVVVLSGPDYPFGFINRFLFVHAPGMRLFRDITKFSALVSFAYALALGLGAAALVARLRRSGRAETRLLAGALSAVALVLYTALMHDAFNPARFSNFAVFAVPAQDLRLQSFLERQPGVFRTVLYPNPGAYFVGTDRRPVISGGDFPHRSSPNGVFDLVENQLDPFSFYKSELAWPLLRGLNVRFLVVHDDTTAADYRPFEYGIQRAEALAFFRTRQWLREVASFGKNTVFRVEGARNIPAFIAPVPLSFEGSPKGLAALGGTDFLQDRVALFFGYPWRIRDRASNLVRGGELVDPASDLLLYAPRVQQRWGRLLPYSPNFVGTAFSRFAMPAKVWGVSGGPAFEFDFQTLDERPAALHYVVREGATQRYAADPARIRPVRTRRAGSQTSWLSDTSSDPLNFDPHFIPVDPTGLGPGLWLGLRTATGTIGIANSTPYPETVDITIPAVVSPDLRFLRVRITVLDDSGRVLREAQHVVVNEPTGWFLGGGTKIRLRHIPLEPGRNQVVLSVLDRQPPGKGDLTSPYSLMMRADVKVSLQKPELGRSDRARSDRMTPRNGRATLGLFDGVAIPLFKHPTFCLWYDTPPHSTTVQLRIGLHALEGERTLEYSRILQTAAIRDEDLYATIQSSLDDAGVEGTPARGFNDAFLDNSAFGRPPEASDYEVSHVYLDIERTSGRRTADSPATLVIRSATIHVGDEPYGSCGFSTQPFEEEVPAPTDRRMLGDRVPGPIAWIDGRKMPPLRTRLDVTQGLLLADTAPVLLQRGPHLIASLGPSRLDAALLRQGSTRRWPSANVADFRQLSDAEYVGRIDTRAGFLVWPATYDEKWALALVPPGATPLTGNLLLDAWRTRKYRVPSSEHLMANGLVNAWRIPNSRSTVVFLYDADVASSIAALAWAILSFLLTAIVLLKAR